MVQYDGKLAEAASIFRRAKNVILIIVDRLVFIVRLQSKFWRKMFSKDGSVSS